MDNILEISKLYKSYKDFALKDVSFSLPEGCITGFIGTNLAGMDLKLVLSVLLIASAIYSIYMPALYKFGYEKTRLLYMIAVLVIPFLFSRIDIKIVTDSLAKITYPAMFLISVVALFLSMIASIKIFNGKEL